MKVKMMVVEVVTAPNTIVFCWNHPKELHRISEPLGMEGKYGNICIPLQSSVIDPI
jgi:hypothetical protein